MDLKEAQARPANLTSRLVQVESIRGNEEAVCRLARDEMESLGFDGVWIDKAGNAVGTIAGTDSSAPRVLIDCHLDTVEPGAADGWTHSPYGGEIVAGRVYGRGAADMKGAMAAAILAATSLRAGGRRPRGDVFICGSVLEESVEGGALRAAVEENRPDAVIIGEATNLDLAIGQRGRAELVFEVTGRQAHSSSPHLGINAVEKMADLICQLRGFEPPSHPLLGRGVLALTDVISEPFPATSMVPHRCAVTYDRRLVVGETEATVLADMAGVLEEMAKIDGDFRARVLIPETDIQTYTGYRINLRKFFPAWALDRDHSIAQASLAALGRAGLAPALGAYDFCTNGSYSRGVAGIPTIGFGPGREEQAHTIDEYVEVEQLQRAVSGYRELLLALTGTEHTEED